ncbi:MAG: hypothetical protein IKA36_01810 [Clostridia bacterium]|nr:hypothetical protein [Clostridia bacterium]
MLNLIVAPENISHKGEKITKRIVKYLKLKNEEYAVYFSHNLKEVGEFSSSLTGQGETEFVVIGDDSVIHEFINAAKDLNKIKFGIIPTSKNDNFASFLKINSNPIKAIEQILERKVENIDYLIVNDQKVINNVLIGASAELFDIYNNLKVKNGLTKKFVMMKYGNKFEGIDLRLNSKNFKTKGDTIFDLNISNGGNHYKKQMSPLSNIQDGLFNLNYVAILDKIDRKKYLKKYKKGTQIYDEKTEQYWIEDLVITPAHPDEKIRTVIDNQIMLAESIKVNIVENGIKLFKNTHWTKY